MIQKLQEQTTAIIKKVYDMDMQPEFSRPPAEHGDFATNVALQLAGKLSLAPREIAQKLASELTAQAGVETSVAGPGFINIRLSDATLFSAALAADTLEQPLTGKTVVTEYSDPNPFKVLHAGHLYTSLVGDAISNIVEAAGATVHRVNFGGDVGLHVAKAMWSIIQDLGGEQPEKLHDIPKSEKLDWVSARYVAGNEAYETDETAKAEIVAINKRIYELHAVDDHSSPFAQIYWTCRQWSYDGFDDLYERLGMVPFEKYYPESATTPLGQETVQAGLEKGVFEKSDGATVFKGEKLGLHTRVFINSEGLPTYEAKDLGLSLTKWQDYAFDQSIIITGNDIQEYMKVIIAVVSAFNKQAAERTLHLTHGQIKLAGGRKMSSRAGTILRADDILSAAEQAAADNFESADMAITLGAVRYSFLRNRLGGDIIYNPEESVKLEGNSGPYLQYALVRAHSILKKADGVVSASEVTELDEAERSLARTISVYPEAYQNALRDHSPHHICNYLYDLAVAFNRFYENSRVVGHERTAIRVSLVTAYKNVLKSGLTILGMPQPEKM